jgi:aspartate carbamoyltransferase catalytic subunit
MLKSKHLIGLENFPTSDLNKIIDTSFKFKEILQGSERKVNLLKDKTIVNMFFENSTRTKISFTLAEKRLGADSINFSSSTSSVKKGETLKDTIQNIDAMKIDGAVIRHGHPGSALKLTEYIDGAVINAGDGSHEHPTQAILDMVTLKEKFGKIKDLKVGIIGDILNSRVARSDIFALKKLGAEIVMQKI